MPSGLHSVKRIEVRDLDGIACGLLIGKNAAGQVVIGVAPQQGDTEFAALTDTEVTDVLRLVRKVLRGEEL
jgi:hypothetical protein